MLSDAHFYHRITRKIVVAFGSIFNNLKLVRYNQAGTIEIERIVVPLTYASKEKFFSRITQEPNLIREVQIVLPRMSFDLASISYDPLRKTSSFIESYAPDSNTGQIQRVKKTPYNFDFNLYIYVRNTEDGTQLIEQILPYFNPDYTVTVDLVNLDGVKLDIPIVLNSIQYTPDDTGSPETLRMLTWTMSFTAKAYMFGPMYSTGNNIIRKVTANTYDSTFNTDQSREIKFNSGSGTFKVGELVYQGNSISSAYSTAYVKSWSNTTNTLVVFDTVGTLKNSKIVTGVVSGAKYNVSSFGTEDYQLYNITVTPDPIDAEPDEDYGFTTVILEAPNI